jgi:hypothetical protein
MVNIYNTVPIYLTFPENEVFHFGSF